MDNNRIILKGENLGERHHYLNNLVQNYSAEKKLFDNLPDGTPIDKIFKIDVANSQKNTNYILLSLKEDDMLYVSRALKCAWLLNSEYSNIINPTHLETMLFPEMIKPAVNKMKHWIQLNLKNCDRCQQFYEYYKSNFDVSIKFLWRCSQEFIIKEFYNIIEKITPKHLKILCEACPHIAKEYFEGLQKKPKALSNYFDDISSYSKSINCVLKKDGNLFLDILESFFDEDRHERLNSTTTRYIMVHYKNRFMKKREWYTSKLLNVTTVANCLSADECKDLLLVLARAEYISNWFQFSVVEPLIKRISPQERAALKKLIFVDKNIGEKVKEWPYKIPTPLQRHDSDEHIFNDIERDYYDCEYLDDCFDFKRMLKKRKYQCYAECAMMSRSIPQKTLLDQLYSRYRFAGFSKTFTELRSRLQIASTIEERQSILLVLVSKSGQVPAQVEALVKLLAERHTNEPSNLRAAIVRSLVKRGCFWRVADNIWTPMLTFGHGLGLDGFRGDPLCVEGLHAVMLRHLTQCTQPLTEVLDAFKKKFTTFKEYKLNINEIKMVKENLPSMLLPECPNEFLEFIKTYKIKIENVEGAVDLLAAAARDNPDLLNRLFDNKIARRQLIEQTFPIKQFEASYINALRHNVSLLAEGKSFAALVTKEKTNHDRFLQILNIYFSEADGLAAKHLTALEEAFCSKAELRFVRPLAILSSSHVILNKIKELDPKDKNISKIVAGFKANAHKSRPAVDVYAADWKLLGAKAIANRLFISRAVSLEKNIKSCLQWRPTYGIALRLALNSPFEVEAFATVSERRPIVALNVAVSYNFSESRIIDLKVWEIIKTILLNTDYNKLPKRLCKKLTRGVVPSNIEPDFWSTIYIAKSKIKKSKPEQALSKLESMLSKVESSFIENVITDFLKKDLIAANFNNYNLSACGVEPETEPNISNEVLFMYMRIIAKYLLICQSEDERNLKIQKVLNPLFDRLDEVWSKMRDKSNFLECIDEFLRALKYTEVFINTEYVSCIPMFEQVIVRLQNILPRKEYFEKYVKLHFILLYFRAIRTAVGQNPDLFKEESKQNATTVVGLKFGQYIGSEITELVSEFFVSIVDIYKAGLKDFLSNYFPYNKLRNTFISCIVKGLLKNSNLEAQLVAEYIFYHELNDEEDILNIIKKSQHNEVQFFLNANVFA